MEFKCCNKNSIRTECIRNTHSFLKVISDKHRLQVLCVLQDGSKCVCEIVQILEISEKLASHHLKQLKSIGLLNEKREGNFIRYALDRKKIKEYKKLFNQVIK